jgi:transcription-repair coupling factor (superfamily II helicase)
MKFDFLVGAVSNRDQSALESPPTNTSQAGIPETYIRDSRLRIQAYRKIAAVSDLVEVKALRLEFRDRYGRLPRQVRLLLQTAEVKVLAAGNHIETVETRDDKIMLTQRGQLFQITGKFPRFAGTRPEQKLNELMQLLQSLLQSTQRQ